MIRSSLMILFKSDPKVDVKEVKTQSMLGRCKMLRAASHFLTEKAFKCRKAYFVKKDVGVLVKSVPKAKDPMEALSGGSDPMAAMGMMKGQMVFMVSQGLLAYWVSHLFSSSSSWLEHSSSRSDSSTCATAQFRHFRGRTHARSSPNCPVRLCKPLQDQGHHLAS
mmetsp:Transcript_6509/g.7280  ORF Transcript_6509/g.7280 Transcript_6509/m.7280 type:complete len:165 (+) Transcript_6509:25-519(+)